MGQCHGPVSWAGRLEGPCGPRRGTPALGALGRRRGVPGPGADPSGPTRREARPRRAPGARAPRHAEEAPHRRAGPGGGAAVAGPAASLAARRGRPRPSRGRTRSSASPRRPSASPQAEPARRPAPAWSRRSGASARSSACAVTLVPHHGSLTRPGRWSRGGPPGTGVRSGRAPKLGADRSAEAARLASRRRRAPARASRGDLGGGRAGERGPVEDRRPRGPGPTALDGRAGSV